MAYTVVGGGLSTYIPSTNDLATGALQVEFTRSVNTFALSRYAQLVPTTKMTGYYLRQDNADNSRVTDEKEFAWPLGNDRPTGKQNGFDFVQYTTARFGFPFYIPQESAMQASWDTVAQHARSKAQLAMTRRSMAASTVLSTNASWGTNYTTAAGSAGPSGSNWIATGSWANSSTADRFIQKSIQQAMRLVSLSSGGAVNPNQLILVISPTTAQTISQAPEIQDYVKFQAGIQYLQGSDTFAKWGIPPTLFGLADVVVEDAVKVTSKKGATEARSYVLGNGAYFMSRPGGLVGVEGASSFSTLQIFAYEDMTVEQFDDPMNRRIEGRVIDNSIPALVAPVGGFAIQNVLA
jgi:hypothetical protein